jgi:hypothetical protein
MCWVVGLMIPGFWKICMDVMGVIVVVVKRNSGGTDEEEGREGEEEEEGDVRGHGGERESVRKLKKQLRSGRRSIT